MTVEEYIDKCLQLNLNLKDGISGEYKLSSCVYEKGTKYAIVPNDLQSAIMGDSYKVINLENSFRYYDLFKGNERLMTGDGIEMYEQYVPYLRAKGRVLIGGLGLGYIARLMCDKYNVEKVTVIEFSSDVIKLCGFKHDKLELINNDFYDYIRKENLNSFNYIYIDTYTAGDEIYPEIIIPTRRFLLSNYPTIPFDFWQDDKLKIKYLLDNKLINAAQK